MYLHDLALLKCLHWGERYELLGIQLLPNRITEILLPCDPVLAAPSILHDYCDYSQIAFRVIH